MKLDAESLFEASWEVCNKVGGIYTVIKSKAALVEEYYGSNYILIGPYFHDKAAGEFSEILAPDAIKKIFEEMSSVGIVCRYGKWLIAGQPITILIDFTGYRRNLNDIKKELWDKFRIDSLRVPDDYNDPVVWAYCAGILIQKLAEHLYPGKRTVAQFHEWLAGPALLYLKSRKVRVATVFTTHATVLGRTLAGQRIDFYSMWDKLHADSEAIKYNVEGKHTLEKQSALQADIFTTVSETTGIEAEHFLGRKPDVLVYNGLEINKFPTFEEIAIKHRIERDKIREFIFYYFFPYYKFDIKETLFYFIAGRNEFRAKGIDIYIRALGELNKRMKEQKSTKTIVAFVWVPTNARGIRAEVIENRIHYQDIKDGLDDIADQTHKNIIYSFVGSKEVCAEELFDEEFLLEMKGKISKLAKKGIPGVSTHYLDDTDEILTVIRQAGLANDEQSPVKIVYYPTYLNGADGLLNQTYYEAMQGSHLGVFPSQYEPWGYTPLEAGALGVSSVTTDLAGFGLYLLKNFGREIEHNHGIFVLQRMNKDDNQVIAALVDVMYKFSNLSANDRIASKLHARHLAAQADWKDLVKNYLEAYNRAVSKIG